MATEAKRKKHARSGWFVFLCVCMCVYVADVLLLIFYYSWWDKSVLTIRKETMDKSLCVVLSSQYEIIPQKRAFSCSH